MDDEAVRKLQAEAMEQLKKDMARIDDLENPLRVGRKLLAVQFAKARYRKGLSQGELAAKVGMSQSQISNIENAKGNPTLDALLRIAQVLDATLVVE